MKTIPELLVPAGGPLQLKAAVQNGADSVYIGGKLFNARQNADNFTDEELVSAIRYAHAFGVHVYITCNTLVSDQEMPEALQYATFVYNAGADAIIVQDIGLASLLKKMMPDMRLHLSTQASIYNIEGMQIAAEMGFSRVVLARELHKQEVREITAHAPIEAEVFVHGALCVSYSGQCLMSSMIGGRSGNRGICAQPCRLPYQLFEKETCGRDKKIGETCHLLSPADLCLLPRLAELIETGVNSVKIEGRMKSPEYVAITTRIYRKYLDRYAAGDVTDGQKKMEPETIIPEEKDMQALLQIFSRGGFTTGYFEGKQGSRMIAAERGKHEGIYLGKVIRYNHSKRSVDIKLESKLSIGDGIEIIAEGLPGNLVTSLKKNQERCDAAHAGDTVRAGYIQGNIVPGNRVYKISDKQMMKEARASFEHGPKQVIPIRMSLIAKKGKKVELFACLSDSHLDNKDQKPHNINMISAYICQSAHTKPLTEKSAQEQLSKTGGTPFYLDMCEVEIDEGVAVPLSEINALRRQALAGLTEKLQIRYPDRKLRQMPTEILREEAHDGDQVGRQNTANHAGKKTSLYFFAWKGMEELPDFPVHRIYLPYQCFLEQAYEKNLRRYREQDIELVAAFPAVTKGYHDQNIRKRLQELAEHPYIGGVMIGNLGHLAFCRDMGLPVYADASLNVYNAYTAKRLGELGVRGVSISYELTAPPEVIAEGHPEYEVIVRGDVPVMYSEYCPVSCCHDDDTGRKRTKRPGKGSVHYLVDRMGEKLPLLTDCQSCRVVIFSSDKQKTGRQKKIRVGNVARLRLNVLDQTPDDTGI